MCSDPRGTVLPDGAQEGVSPMHDRTLAISQAFESRYGVEVVRVDSERVFVLYLGREVGYRYRVVDGRIEFSKVGRFA